MQKQYFENPFEPVDSFKLGASFDPSSVQFDLGQLEVELIEGS